MNATERPLGMADEHGRCAYCGKDKTVHWNGRRWLCAPCWEATIGGKPPVPEEKP